MIVVDTNIISYFYLNSDYSSNAGQRFKKIQFSLCHYCGEVNSGMFFHSIFYIERNILSLTEVIDIFEIAEELLNNNEYEINSM